MPTRSESSENVKVFYRIYPTESPNADHVKIDKNSQRIYIRHLQELSKNASFKNKATYWEFKSDGVFVNCEQERIYLDVAYDVVKEVTEGYNGLIISYGQTKTGKTFTSTGLHYSEQEFGIAPRALSQLLELKEKQPKHFKTCIQMSCIEFGYKDSVDLLKETSNHVDFYKCRDVTKVKVHNEEEALKYLYLAEGRKEFNSNCAEYFSNVYSSVITFYVTVKNMELTNPQNTTSRLHIIDLPGNDMFSNFRNAAKSQNAISLANTAKSNLELFSLCLKENIPQHIRLKHRTNALLYYLDGDFGNESNLRFLGHLRLLSEDILITLSMLRFGTTFKRVRAKKKEKQFVVNEEIELQYLRQKVKDYTRDSYLNSMLLNEDLTQGLTEERMQHLNRTVQDYLKNNIDQITVMNVADASMVFKMLKEICNQQENEIKKLQHEKQMLAEHSEASLKHSEGSKSSTRSQSGIRSRRSSRKSKDSLSNTKNHESTTSEKRIKTLVGKAEMKPSVEECPADAQNQYRKLRKSKSSVTRRSSVSKQKSSTTSIEKRNASAGELNLPLPDTVKDNQELWATYVTQQSKQYKERIEEYKVNEKNVKDSYYELYRDIKKMHSCKDHVNKCCNELLEAQTYRKFNSKDEFDENGLLVISFAEKTCKHQLELAQKKLVEQQEKTLKSQEELKIFLGNRQKIYKKLCEEFEKFCMDQYKIPNVETEMIENNIQAYTFDADMEKPIESEEKEKLFCAPEPSKKSELIKHLQDLMIKEMKKKKKSVMLIKKDWKNVAKKRE